jgi:molybdate transport system substrate-binding protein
VKIAAVLAAAVIVSACARLGEEEVRVAVAANFLGTLRALEPAYERATGGRLVITSGSTGLLYAQIRNGAPFDILLSADQERPRLLVAEGYGDESDVFTYAVGRLALWPVESQRLDARAFEELADSSVRWIAIAEPEVAPYGYAAKQALERAGAWEAVNDRIVRGQNVAQAFAMVETGNADVGFVALSQALAWDGPSSYAIVPQALHDPIRQDAIVLRHGADNKAVRDFVEFLRSPAAARVLEHSGYSIASATE